MTSTTTEAPAKRWRPEGFTTRRPTGRTSWPLILVEGPEYTGKTWHCAKLSGSDKIGQAFFLDLAEGHSDEYIKVPGADYEIIEHDGSFRDIMAKIDMVRMVAEHAVANGDKPVLLIIDSMTAMWRLLSMWANNRALNSKANKKKLAEDPDAEIDTGRNYWNDANERHANLVSLLRRIPGIVVMTGRGKWVSGTDRAGQPTKEKEYTLETQKSLGYSTNCWVRLDREKRPMVVGMRSPDPAKSIKAVVEAPQPILKSDWDLEWLIFNLMELDPANTAVPNLVMPKPDRSPEQIRDEALLETTGWEQLRKLHEESTPFHGVIITNENRADETLGDLITRLAMARQVIVSDPATVALLNAKVDAAPTAAALNAVGQTISAAIAARKLGEPERSELYEKYKARMAHLRAAEQAVKLAKETQEAGA
ncbi:AAA family ATPase (plasmid) [Streptosporangium sandarakinum]|uniref:AAA family ATPase n=1 Tax=Streptosporangium sandarakinum TaxID=1260955 RepID=UPI003D928103